MEANHTHIIHFLAELCLTFDPKWDNPTSVTPLGDFNAPLTPGASNFVLQLPNENENEITKMPEKVKLEASKKRLQLDNALKKILEASMACTMREVTGPLENGENETQRELPAATWAALVCIQYLRYSCLTDLYFTYSVYHHTSHPLGLFHHH